MNKYQYKYQEIYQEILIKHENINKIEHWQTQLNILTQRGYSVSEENMNYSTACWSG